MLSPQGSSWLLQDVCYMEWYPPCVKRGDIRVRRGWIEEVGENLQPRADEQVFAGAGAWIMPGLVCGHTHLYSALSCGMPMPSSAPVSFADMLDKVWWRLDRALHREAVKVSALVGGVSALRVGVTTLIDHHASPNAIEHSLLDIDDALAKIGLRRILCYEVTDRGGQQKAEAGLKAHEALLLRSLGIDSEGRRAVLIGAHANFTLSDETLRQCVSLAQHAGVGLHIHVAEAEDDAKITGENPVLRLERLGALRSGSLLAHCVHTTADDLRRIVDAGAWIAHQPRSNMNNAVGYAPVEVFPEQTILGTDGIGADMLTEIQTAWYQGREAHLSWSPERWLQVLQQGSSFASHQLGVQMGRIQPGYVADLVVLDADPGPPLRSENLAAAVIFRFSPRWVRHVMIHGSWALWEGQPVGIDKQDLHVQAEITAQEIWDRMKTLSSR